jgi:antitoxin YokJ
MKSIQALFEVIKVEHEVDAPLDASKITSAEQKLGYPLPDDLKEFYSLSNGAMLRCQYEAGIYNEVGIYGLEYVERIRTVLLGESGDDDECAPPSWYAICRVQSGYIIVDLATVQDNHCLFYFSWEDSTGWEEDSPIIARSFTELLNRLIESEGEKYWRRDNFER